MAGLLLAIALLSNQGLRWELADRKAEIVTLTTQTEALKAAQVVLEETHAKRLADAKAMAVIRKDIDRAEDADLPDPIVRALDGLRDRAPEPRHP